MNIYQRLIRLNFTLSVWIMIVNGIAVLFNPHLLFSDSLELYGPLIRNLGLVMLYLAIAELILWYARYSRNGHREALFAGGFIVITVIGIRFYSMVNHLPFNNIALFIGLYVGLSHLFYYASKQLIGSS